MSEDVTFKLRLRGSRATRESEGVGEGSALGRGNRLSESSKGGKV